MIDNIDMDNILYDGVDVGFQIGIFDGTPVLVLFDSGPIWSAIALSTEYNDLRFRIASIPDQEDRIVLFQKDKFLFPVLTTSPDNDIVEFALDTEKGKPWLLAIQVSIDNQKKTVVWITQGLESAENRTKSFYETYIDRWLFEG